MQLQNKPSAFPMFLTVVYEGEIRMFVYEQKKKIADDNGRESKYKKKI